MLFFNWSAVVGADKYKLELQYSKDSDTWVNKGTQTVVSKTYPIPPTTATVTSKKPFAEGKYRWRVTPINTDIGIDSAGTGQTSKWFGFTVSTFYEIVETYPQTITGTTYAYSGEVASKNGDGKNLAAPELYWIVANGYALNLNPTLQFVVTVKQGAKKYKTVVNANTNCESTDYDYSGDQDGRCKSALPEGLASLTEGVPYTWEVYATDAPNSAFGVPWPVSTTAKDIVEYNSVGNHFTSLSTAVVSDTMYTNKPTFKWDQPADGLPARGGAYQLLIEKFNEKLSPHGFFTYTRLAMVTIIPGSTKNPATKALTCPSSGGSCYYTFATPFTGGNYRWNVRIITGAKYGPWASPYGIAPDMRSMTLDAGSDANDYGNWFWGITKPGSAPDVSLPTYNQVLDVAIDSNPNISWRPSSAYAELYYDFGSHTYMRYEYSVREYRVELKRVSPAPLTTTNKVISILDKIGSGSDNQVTRAELNTALPAVYQTYGLPRGIYEVVVTPQLRLNEGQLAIFKPAVKSQTSRFVIGPSAPAISAVFYSQATKKMNVIFTPESSKSAKDVKYRVLVNMVEGSLSRWVKLGSFSGVNCTANTSPCTLSFNVYKPGTKLALDNAYQYQVRIQDAMKEEGSATKWGPFGPLSTAPGTGVVFE